MNAELRLGVDGGGTSTEAVLAQKQHDGRWVAVGRGHATGCNRDGYLDVEPIALAIEAAFANSGQTQRPVAYGCLALAGAGRASVVRDVTQWVEERALANKFKVVSDIAPLLSAGAPADRVVAVICGTGSIAFDGTSRAGGLGPALGDEGSGYWMGMESLRRVAATLDGRGDSVQLRDRVLEALSVNGPTELTAAEFPRFVSQLKRDQIAALARTLLLAWGVGEHDATQVVNEAVEHLRALVHSVQRKSNQADIPCLVLAGGVFNHHRPFLQAFVDALRVDNQISAIRLVHDPAALVTGVLPGWESLD